MRKFYASCQPSRTSNPEYVFSCFSHFDFSFMGGVVMYKCFQRVFLWICASTMVLNVLSVPAYAYISFDEGGVVGTVVEWLGGSTLYDAIAGKYKIGRAHV